MIAIIAVIIGFLLGTFLFLLLMGGNKRVAPKLIE